MNPNSLFSLGDHLEKLSKDGDPLERNPFTLYRFRIRMLRSI